jgi:hypothetical protein
MKSYRKVMGLFYKCGDKFNAQHQCAQTAYLHIIEELLELLEGPTSLESFTTTVDACINSLTKNF